MGWNIVYRDPDTPAVLGSALVADNEGDGVASRVLTLSGVAAGGITLLSWVAIRTAIFAGPPTANNGNSYTQVFSEIYSPDFNQYSCRGYRAYEAAGGSNHTLTVTKSSGNTEELTSAILAVTTSEVFDSAVVVRNANGAGASHTSGVVTTTKGALLVAIGSGTGNVNVTAPTQTWPSEWTVLQSVARSEAQAPNGHIPFYLAVRQVATPGDYSVAVQTAINEGIMLALYAMQVP